MGQLTFTQQDYDGDVQSTTIYIEDAASAVDLATWQTANAAYLDALRGITIGREKGYAEVADATDNGPGSATSPVAQKSTQMIFEYVTADGRDYAYRYGMPDLTLPNVWIKQGGLTVLDLASTEGAAMKAQFDARARHRNDDDTLTTVTLQRVYIRE